LPLRLGQRGPFPEPDFYINLGDVIYETASNVAGSAKDPNNAANPAPWLNSPSVTLSGTIPAPSATGATQAQLFADYSKKYRENFFPVNTGGQNSLQVLYAAQINYTTWDNHELGNRQYINGGAPAAVLAGCHEPVWMHG
jgi:phosphodiesterase/alkaline phosphatase D-like protein